MTTALGLALILVLVRKYISDRRLERPVMVTTGLVWIGAILIYFLIGQPGFYGNQLLVVMEDQVDPSEYGLINDYDVRRQAVYEALTKYAYEDQQQLRRDLERLGIDYTPYYLVNSLAVDAGPLVRLWLETRPDVDRILDNPVLRPLPASPEKSAGSANAPVGVPWNLTLIGADKVWETFGVTGEGIVVGQSDSGIQGDHPELAESYRGRDGSNEFNWFDPWNHTEEPVDISGHGTHTLGLIVGKNTGVAPDAEWFGCVNLARNLANPALYLDCMQFMLAPFPMDGDPFIDGDPTLSAHIINNSWGCPEKEGCDSDALVDAVRAMRAAGIFVVASAGNEGPACETVQHPLALYDEVFSVGAIDQGGNLASFSSRGPVTVDGSGRTKPDIVAPGVDVLSSFPNSSYEYLPGTSMAGPHVAGVVALIWSANPALIGNIERTEEILRMTAGPYDGSLPSCVSSPGIPNNAVGYGIVDAYEAVKMALEGK
jgi:subtilisin family serine protease